MSRDSNKLQRIHGAFISEAEVQRLTQFWREQQLADDPLRDRVDDIPLVAYHFLAKYRRDRKAERIDPKALKALQAYKWPGNIRELEHVIEYALSMAEQESIQVTDLPEKFVTRLADRVSSPESWANAPLSKAKEEFEKIYITQILKESNWNISEASRKAQMFRQNLQQKIRLLGLDLSSIAAERPTA